MSKRRKGMSYDQKRATMAKIIMESKSVFKLKELEKLGSKAGVVEQTIKDVLQSLVDDNLVNQDKQIGKLREEESSLKASQADLEKSIENLEKDRPPSKKRTADLESLQSLRAKKAKLTEELNTWKENDPSILDDLAKRVETAKAAANRWTDNIWTFESYLVKKKNADRKVVKKLLGITDSFDYVG